MDAQTQLKKPLLVEEMSADRQRGLGFWLNVAGNVVVVVSLATGVLLLI